MEKDIKDDLFYNKILNVQKGNLESVCFIYWTPALCISILKSNSLFAFILQSCPNLKKFEISAPDDINASGSIYLDFRDNIFLRRARIDMSN